MPVEIEISQAMVQEVMDEWRRENPTLGLDKFPPKEFADKMVAKIKATAKLLPGGTHVDSK